MTTSETKARAILKKQFPNAYIKKIPDFKQTGSSSLRGMPDYLVIDRGFHTWWEIKMIDSVKTFNLKEINENQWIEFKHLLDAGVDVNIMFLDKKKVWHIYLFSRLLMWKIGKKTNFQF